MWIVESAIPDGGYVSISPIPFVGDNVGLQDVLLYDR